MKRLFSWLFRKQDSDLVPYHDFSTGNTVLIPKAELSPGVVLIQIQGQANPVYADATQLKKGNYQHPPFEGAEQEAIRSLVTDLSDVYPMSFEEWEDGFRRDRNPAQEIAAWVHTASILKVMSATHSFDSSRRQECYQILVACLTGPRETVSARSDPRLLTDDQIKQIIKYFYEGGYI
jgi:hypothetical protein